MTKYIISDEAAEVAVNIWLETPLRCASDFSKQMKAALQAALDVMEREEVQSDSEGWIEWSYGECPVNKDTTVIIEYRDGKRTDAVLASEVPWDSIHPDCVPAKYRIVKDHVVGVDNNIETKRETLMQYMLKRSRNLNMETPETLLDMISEYLEECNV